MRVITGTARGMRLKEPSDMKVRPTSDMVKESIFNIIQYEIEGRSVLDLFAGTGQMGIEALSRGARSAVFVDESSSAVALVRENLKRTRLEGAKVIQGESLSFLAGPEKFDLIFLDPPYETNLLEKALRRIVEFDKLSVGGIIVCESSADREPGELTEPYKKLKSYRYGKIFVSVFSRNAD